MKQQLHVLHVEDSPEDSELVQNFLQTEGMDCDIQRIETLSQLLEALERSEYDLILSDWTLPQFSGLEALEIVHNLKPEVPFIFVSGTIGEETAIESLQRGATDYVLKQRLSRFVPAVRRALEEVDKRMMLVTEQQLHQANRLETASLTGGLAHDVKNLLQIVKAQVSLLPLQVDHPDQIIKIADTLNKVTDRGSHLMQELLVFARKNKTHLTAVNVGALVSETADMIEVGLPANIQLVLQVDQGLPPILADPGQIDRMLTNLILNARDAMLQGGAITISTEVVQVDPVTSPSWQLDHEFYLCLKVSDSGTGMDATARLHAFEPFFTTKSAEKSTGLGLSVIFGLMQVHHGFIDLQSEPGEGTDVSLFFPLPLGSKGILTAIKKIPPSSLENSMRWPANDAEASPGSNA